MRDFNYEIKDTYAVISERKNGAERLELNAISYNGRETKISRLGESCRNCIRR